VGALPMKKAAFVIWKSVWPWLVLVATAYLLAKQIVK
jgi:hypothetical protein